MRFMCFLAFLTVVPDFVLSQSLYEHLDVPNTATVAQIKKAYRRMAMQYHPDKNKDPAAAKIFESISMAYECLSDKDRRRRYDSMGIEGCKKDGHEGFDGGDHPFASFFGSMFGGGSEQGGEKVHRGDDIVIDLPVTLEEIYNGKFIEIIRSKSVKKSMPGTRKCNCHMEMKTKSIGPGRFQMMQEQVCGACPNYEFVREDRQLEVEIELGMPDGYIYPFPGEGEPHIDGENGNLQFIIKQQTHPFFHRQGDDLYTNVSISLTSALTGINFEIIHLDGHSVKISRDQVTWPGAVLRVPNEGIPNYENNEKKGHLYVTFDVAFPRDKLLSDQEKEAIISMFGIGESFSPFTTYYGIPEKKPAEIEMGYTPPRVYNGFTGLSTSEIHLGNSVG